MKLLFSLVLQISCVLFLSILTFSQDCQPPEIIFNKNADNIFTEEQENYLGEAIAERVRKNYRIIDDAEINSYVNKIGNRIIKHLPPSNINFSFQVVDLPEANAFITAGGYVYVTRKLIAFVKSEDELAGVIAHELGHGIVRHSAIDMTKLFKEILKVRSLGGRQDVFNKYNDYIEKYRTKRVRFKRSHQNKKQLEADEIGIYAMIAAGYDGKALTEFWDRFTEIEGKTGSWFSDLLGSTKPSQKRYREMLDTMKKIPQNCLDNNSSNSEEFQKWKAYVINYTGLGGKESLTALIKRQRLSPPLRAEIKHIRFSPDGNYVLAQDDSGINVLSKKPFSLIFRINAPDVKPAKFTPDSKFIVFSNAGLRVQKWSITEKRPVSIYETFIRIPCWQTELSSDGSKIACYDFQWNLGVYDVATNDLIYRKKDFYEPSFGEYLMWNDMLESGDGDELKILNMEFSPDSKYLLAGRNFDVKFNSFLYKDRSESIGVDLVKKEKIDLDKNIKKLLYSAFTFYSNDKIIGQYRGNEDKSGIFEFKSGKRLEKFFLRGKSFSKALRGDYLLVRPVSNAPVGVYDLKAKKFVFANKKTAFDIYGTQFIAERKTGELGLYETSKGSLVGRVQLPTSTLGTLRAAALSPDGSWLAMSENSRGGLWNLQTGERIFHVRGFRGGHFNESGLIFADFPKDDKMERMVAVMDPARRNISPNRKIDEGSTRQIGGFMVTIKSNKKEEKKDKEENKKDDEKKKQNSSRLPSKDVTMYVRNSETGELYWSKKFEDERPGYGIDPLNDTLTLVWHLKSDGARNIIKQDPKLKAKLSEMEDKDGDYLIQILKPRTGKLIGQMLIETGEGSFRISGYRAAGDWLLIDDTRNRVLLYSISQDEIRHRFFGDKAAISPENNLLAIENEPGHLVLYDLNTGAQKQKLRFKSRIALLRFPENRKHLFVLTENQEAFLFDAKAFQDERIASGK